jgi:sugar phosphate isomerase/epimerase
MPPPPPHQVYVHLPFSILVERLEQVVQARLNPEIHFNADFLDSPSVPQLEQVKHALEDNGLGCTIHGPFMDLCPAAVDKQIGRVTIQRFLGLIQIAAEFAPRVVVFHPGYDDFRYGDSKELWLQNSLRTWNTVLEEAQKHGLTLALENIFDKDPLLLARLIAAVDSPHFTHCFDIGHYNLYADYPLADWFELLGPYMTEIHLHDNHGRRDEHLALGEGSIDLDALFNQLKQRNLQPALVIEAHTEEHVFLSLNRLGRYLA